MIIRKALVQDLPKIAFSPIVNNDSQILILGTMPGDRSLQLQQYYGHAGNHFWKILFTLFNRPFTKDYEVRTQLLLDHGIALWDVLRACECETSSGFSVCTQLLKKMDRGYADSGVQLL